MYNITGNQRMSEVRTIYIFLMLYGIISLISSCTNKTSAPLRKTAKEILATFRVADGFKIEMVASEPLISSPVDMEIDEYGRMYVVEMPGYPLDLKGSGKIIMLADTNHDGTMDKRIVFKEGLILPTSIMRWKKGLLVTDSPNILYLEDTDNDGVADHVDTLVTGFALTNPQHNLNSPVYGLDNWIYVAHEGAVKTRDYMKEFGDEGREIYFPNRPNSVHLPQNASGRSIRFRPDQGSLEVTASKCQYGQTFDEWGHWFGCNNSNQGYQEVIANRYFERNSELLVSDAVQSMSDHLNAAEVFPTTTNPDRQLLTNVGVMTSACGITAYLGSAFPEPFNKKITFVAEPVSNLVHVDVLKDSGASFVASRVFPNKEFLTSTDAWSRPVNFYVGPDGALYVLDYYRQVIESPEWMSQEAIAAGGLYNGSDMGRIFRITPINGKGAGWIKGLHLGDAPTEELVQHLADANGWWRMNAQRLLVDRADKKATPLLEKMAVNKDSPMGRLHALWTLEGIGALSTGVIEAALKDTVAGVRENAIRLAELHLSASPLLSQALLSMQNDVDAKVRFQLLLTLGYLNTAEASRARNKLLFTDINDKWVQIAALTAKASQTASLLSAVLQQFRDDVPAHALLVQRLTAMVGGSTNSRAITQLIRKATTPQAGKNQGWQAAILKGLEQGMENRKSVVPLSEPDQQMLVKTFFATTSPELRQASLQLLQISGITDKGLQLASVAKAMVITTDTSISDKKRADAIDFVSLGDPLIHITSLQNFLVPQEHPLVQLAALRTLSHIPSDTISKYLISQWPVLTTEIRDAAIDIFMENPDRMKILIEALEKQKILISSVSFGRSVSLMQVKDESLRNRARKLFTKNSKQAKEVNKQYQKALELNGDPLKGKEVYVQNCAICHQVRGKFGVQIGPDLGTIHNWKKEDIMANILDPSLSIYPGYELWEFELNNNESVQGIIVSETSSAIMLRNNGKPDRTINRQDVKSLKSLNISAMPAGLEKNINERAMADLLSFLRQN
jgi:putative membrane-bound dehydrogenase-like protein